MSDKARLDKEAAWALARRQGWSPRVERSGRVYELMAVRHGRLYVYETCNQSAAASAAVDLIRNIPPYEVNGAGQTVGVWDAGAVRSTHQELTGRVSILNNVGVVDHSTHVAGTIGAMGFQIAAMGMAPSVHIDSYDWTADLAEMTSRAMAAPGETGKIQISSHSYVYATGWDNNSSPYRWYGTWGDRESEDFGQYGDLAHSWDQLCYDAPYYLPVNAAGNDRDDITPTAGAAFEYWADDNWHSKAYDPETDPYADNWDNGGYDTVNSIGTAKNVLTVGAVFDAYSGGLRDPSNAAMTVFSAWGPTDDGRVKPDLVASGMNVYSCTAGGNASYATYNGTSTATPVISGSAALLVEYYNRLFPGQYMRSCMLKGLIISSADDLGPSGPDYRNGWGLINAQAAAELLRLHQQTPNNHRLVDGVLTTSEPTQVYTYLGSSLRPLKITICWTDPPASPLTGLDNPSPRLVNDLDLRVSAPDGTTVYYPYVLDPASPASPASTGDNVRDNVEQVMIPSPVTGIYTAQIACKGSLANGQQHYALLAGGVVSPVTGDFDRDEDVDGADLFAFEACATGPGVTPAAGCENKDLDLDGDVDQSDFARWQRCYAGQDNLPPQHCFE